jgi:hypothetical protein
MTWDFLGRILRRNKAPAVGEAEVVAGGHQEDIRVTRTSGSRLDIRHLESQARCR